MVKVKQLRLRIFAQFLIIIAPITLVLIYQAVSDLRRTAAIEKVLERQRLSRTAKEDFDAFVTFGADAVDTGSLGQRAFEALNESRTALSVLQAADPGARTAAVDVQSLARQVTVAMPLNQLLTVRSAINQSREAIRVMDAGYERASNAAIAQSIETARRQSRVVAAATLFTLLIAAWFM